MAVIALASIHIKWIPFKSTNYPYRIQQPSSFRYIQLTDSAGHKIDYFFPGVGSTTTNVNILANTDRMGDAQYLQSINGHNVRPSGTVFIAGQKRSLTGADFRGVAGRWRVERTSFSADGLVWHLTMSYEPRYASMRPIMVTMLTTFQLGNAAKGRR